MYYSCNEAPCNKGWVVPYIPPQCEKKLFNVNRIEWYSSATTALPKFTVNSSENFTLGPVLDHNLSLEIESNLTEADMGTWDWFDATDYNVWGIPWDIVDWDTNEGSPPQGFSKTRYETELSPKANLSIVSGWGGVRTENQNMIEKKLAYNIPQGLYHVTLFGVFRDQADLDVNVFDYTISWEKGEASYRTTDFLKLNHFPQPNLTPKGQLQVSRALYGGCTLPDALPIDNTSTIKIEIPSPEASLSYPYWDKIEITSVTASEAAPFWEQGIPWCGDTYMKCGDFENYAEWPQSPVVIGTACNTSDIMPPVGNCGEPDSGEPEKPDCVYMNESGGPTPSPQCFAFNATTVNANGTTIQCSEESTWCPKHFYYEESDELCRPSTAICDYGYNGTTERGCETINATPGFLHNREWCLNDFDDYPVDGPTWHKACCEMIRIPMGGDSSYLFFDQRSAIIY